MPDVEDQINGFGSRLNGVTERVAQVEVKTDRNTSDVKGLWDAIDELRILGVGLVVKVSTIVGIGIFITTVAPIIIMFFKR